MSGNFYNEEKHIHRRSRWLLFRGITPYGIIGFGAQGSSYVNILTGTPAFPGFPAAAIPANCELGAICDIDEAKREAEYNAELNKLIAAEGKFPVCD